MSYPIVLMGQTPGRYAVCCNRPAKQGHVVLVDEAPPHSLTHVWCLPESPVPQAEQECLYIGCPLPVDENGLCTSHHALYCAPRHPNDEGIGHCPMAGLFLKA